LLVCRHNWMRLKLKPMIRKNNLWSLNRREKTFSTTAHDQVLAISTNMGKIALICFVSWYWDGPAHGTTSTWIRVSQKCITRVSNWWTWSKGLSNTEQILTIYVNFLILLWLRILSKWLLLFVDSQMSRLGKSLAVLCKRRVCVTCSYWLRLCGHEIPGCYWM
jgi:hypothetical protein